MALACYWRESPDFPNFELHLFLELAYIIFHVFEFGKTMVRALHTRIAGALARTAKPKGHRHHGRGFAWPPGRRKLPNNQI